VTARLRGIRGVVLDIEGTTTPVSFVYDVLFPYARSHLREFLASELATSDVEHERALLIAEFEADLRGGESPPDPRRDATLPDYVEWLMDRDRKSPGLKLLQGRIWERGYADGTLVGEVFQDVPPALERWTTAGVEVAIYSSGSVLGQRLLFGHTKHGDLTRYIDVYFDTGVGAKRAQASYVAIAKAMRHEASELLFASDVPQELDAAAGAGMRTVLCVRPGNAPVATDGRDVIQSFDELR
jgi:enolase-phosphatase E1